MDTLKPLPRPNVTKPGEGCLIGEGNCSELDGHKPRPLPLPDHVNCVEVPSAAGDNSTRGDTDEQEAPSDGCETAAVGEVTETSCRMSDMVMY